MEYRVISSEKCPCDSKGVIWVHHRGGALVAEVHDKGKWRDLINTVTKSVDGGMGPMQTVALKEGHGASVFYNIIEKATYNQSVQDDNYKTLDDKEIEFLNNLNEIFWIEYITMLCKDPSYHYRYVVEGGWYDIIIMKSSPFGDNLILETQHSDEVGVAVPMLIQGDASVFAYSEKDNIISTTVDLSSITGYSDVDKYYLFSNGNTNPVYQVSNVLSNSEYGYIQNLQLSINGINYYWKGKTLTPFKSSYATTPVTYTFFVKDDGTIDTARQNPNNSTTWREFSYITKEIIKKCVLMQESSFIIRLAWPNKTIMMDEIEYDSETKIATVKKKTSDDKLYTLTVKEDGTVTLNIT